MMNKRRTAWLAMTATVIVGALALTGCSTGTSSSTADGNGKPDKARPTNQIHVLVLGDAAAKAEEALAVRFNKTSKVKVIIDKGSTASTDYATQVRTTIGTKSGPDIFMSYGSAGIEPYVRANALLDLNAFIKVNPKLKTSFLPSVFDEETIGGKSYGIPMRGVGPVVLYYNKTVLRRAGLQPATTWQDLLGQVTTLSGKGVTPITVGAADKWPTLMWFEYVYARAIGNAQVAKGLAGDASVWSSAGSKTALADIRTLVNSGAFGKNYDSVHYGTGGTTTLLDTDKAAYELQGNWNYATIAGDNKDFAENDLGWASFPSLSGKGKAGELAGNLSNYYNVAADTRYPTTVAKFLSYLYGNDFVNSELALGNLSPTTNAGTLVNSSRTIPATQKSFLNFQLGIIKKAPTFQLSWDQNVAVVQQANLTNAIAAYFDGADSADQFISAMQSVTAKS